MAPRKSNLRKGRKRQPLRAKKQTVSQAVKKYVNRIVHVDQENKSLNFQAQTTFGNVLQSTNMNMYPILPYTGYGTCPQGITQGGRIGNEIKIRKIMLRYVIYPTGYSATTNPFPRPMEIDMFLGYTKQQPGTLPGTVDIGYLFQAGSSSFGPSGNLGDLVSTPNKDYWTIAKRWQHKVGFSDYAGTGGAAAIQYSANNDFKMNVVRRLDITKHCIKTLKFNDGNNTHQGRNLFFFYQAVSANGDTITSSVFPTTMQYWIDITYEDA